MELGINLQGGDFMEALIIYQHLQKIIRLMNVEEPFTLPNYTAEKEN